jgi:hypothetical protein
MIGLTVVALAWVAWRRRMKKDAGFFADAA